jgi:hypothetical protein
MNKLVHCGFLNHDHVTMLYYMNYSFPLFVVPPSYIYPQDYNKNIIHVINH